jgi:hypothetical protein
LQIFKWNFSHYRILKCMPLFRYSWRICSVCAVPALHNTLLSQLICVTIVHKLMGNYFLTKELMLKERISVVNG